MDFWLRHQRLITLVVPVCLVHLALIAWIQVSSRRKPVSVIQGDHVLHISLRDATLRKPATTAERQEVAPVVGKRKTPSDPGTQGIAIRALPEEKTPIPGFTLLERALEYVHANGKEPEEKNKH